MEKNIPRRRFKEFIGSGEWEEKKLGEVVSYTNGKAHEQNISNDGKYIVINSKFISTDGEVKKFTDVQIEPLFKDEITFVLSDVPNGRAIARTFLIDANDKYTLNQRIARISPFKDVNSYFLYILMNRNEYFLKFDDGVKQTNLSVDDVLSFNAFYPSLAEQEKIGNFFKKLDRLIGINREKLGKLKASKSAYLTEMFPREGEDRPRRRFQGFTGPWEEKKWIDTVDISTNMVNPLKKSYKKLPHIGPGNIESFTGRLLNNIKTVEEDNLISGKFYFVKGDIIYGKINPHLGKYSYVRFNGLASADAYILRSKNELLQKFLFVLIQTKEFYKYSVSVSRRSGIPKINRAELNDYTFLLPSIPEQEKIGDFFKRLDQQIEVQEKKLEKLEKMKKAYLAEMFV